MPGDYRFADLEDRTDLIKEIAELEAKLGQATGDDVTLIAYSKTEDLGCRASLDD